MRGEHGPCIVVVELQTVRCQSLYPWHANIPLCAKRGMREGQGTLVDEGIWQHGKGCDESGRREHALGNEGGDKGRALYWHTNGVGDIGILQEQLYSAKACRLERFLPRRLPTFLPLLVCKAEYKPRAKLREPAEY